ncbi:winged helix-turn-helix domain-containing protein [Kitasatospora sp. NBC_00240]|uniref:winged helix-turn-helix domain-containing protein n=1 Tax=Kitasatospora sp. NBC_00240 TaxID=2903567 RepID=UPI0022528DFF|nr:winged helix-turn-helix domain-containing protein [Kitasatospora sp. NBC_00240]MCX5209574.1 winged helix-turn-helix domain-containing protein [Kitasatospora sp. NBC_00240]
MSSSSTATLSVPSATPHLRAVRAVQPPAAERWHPTAAQQHGPQHAVPQLPPQGLLTALPQGATVVATLPQSALPQGLLAQYGVQFGAAGSHPMVGYLVLVPAEAAPAAAGLAPQAAGPAPSATLASAPDGADGAQLPAKPAGQGITVDTERRNAYVDGKLLDLTYLEFELLAHLTEHPQRVHTRDHLVSAVWGYGHVGDGRTVDVHVARLRRKLGPAYRDSIVTVRRVGYKYTPAA